MVDGYTRNKKGWFRNWEGERRGPSGRYTGRYDWGLQLYRKPECLTVPNLYAAQYAFNRRTEVPETCDADMTNALSKDYLDAMPDELLFMILQWNVPSERIFHFTPQTYPGDDILTTSVHQVCRTEYSPVLDVLSLALTCRRMRSVVYDIFYATNQFILDISPMHEPLASWVKTDCHFKKQRAIGSWNRVYQCARNADGDGPLFPLADSTLRFVTDLKICISLRNIPEAYAFSEGSNALQALQVIQALCESLRSERNRFKDLAIRLDIAEQNGSSYDSRQLGLWCRRARHDHPLKPYMIFNHVTFTPVDLSDAEKAGLRRLCEPLFRLAIEHDVELHGILNRRQGLGTIVEYVPSRMFRRPPQKVILDEGQLVFPPMITKKVGMPDLSPWLGYLC